MENVGLYDEDALDRTKWKRDIHNHSRRWEKPEEKKKKEHISTLL